MRAMEHKFFQPMKLMRRETFLLLYVETFDLFLTAWALRLGMQELNPLFSHSVIWMAPTKIALMFVIYFIMEAKNKNTKTYIIPGKWATLPLILAGLPVILGLIELLGVFGIIK
jgi:hypothetical protein